MRGIGRTFSRLPATLALAVGVAFLCGASAPHALAVASESGQQDAGQGIGSDNPPDTRPPETAMAVPRLRTHGADTDVAMPTPLTASDAARIRRIMALQAQGRFATAEDVLADVDSPLLMGTILAQRYLGPYHRSTPAELRDWLSLYADLPAAPAIHALLLTRLPKGAAPPPAPVRLIPATRDRAPATVDFEETEAPSIARRSGLDRAVYDLAERGNLSGALNAIHRARGIGRDYVALLHAEVAQKMFFRNRDADALSTAQAALRAVPADRQTGLTGYVAGLAAWRLDRIWLARAMFEAAAEAGLATPQQRVATALWAAKASRRLHDEPRAEHWLQQAASGPLTLHGLIARRMLGPLAGFLSGEAVLTQADVDVVAETLPGQRAFALLQVGRENLAADELRLLWPRACNDTAFGRSLALVATTLGMSELATELADTIAEAEGRAPLEPRLPLPRLRPAGGFKVDPALVYALTRLESNFDPTAVSAAGAQGLMQIMPVTARYMAGLQDGIELRLHDPAVNLDIGQRYLAYLSRLDGIGDNLLRLLASYNSGPGYFLRWVETVRAQDDPLMFLEAIPVHETRVFVTGVLTYSWLYAAQLRLPARSLDAMAAGRFPRFTPTAADHKLRSVTPPRG